MSNITLNSIGEKAIELLKLLIATPSFSKVEDKTADLLESFLKSMGVTAHRHRNNIWAANKFYRSDKPTLLLNSHHDTVKPNKGYTLDPFMPIEENGKLFGLGSNDAGASLVALIAAFIYFYSENDIAYNIILAATAEEEISGNNGIEAILPLIGPVNCAIVGEPTRMQMAVAERGLVVLDGKASGTAGHAAREEGENAIYKAMKDIEWLASYHFPNDSKLLGKVKMTVTSIETGNKAHNIIPSECSFIVDVRVNENYQLEEIVETIRANIKSLVKPRSLRMRATSIPEAHPLVQAGLKLDRKIYGSPTTSDKALMPFPALKIGPGDSARSHTANEFIYLDEVREGIDLYIQLLKNLVQ